MGGGLFGGGGGESSSQSTSVSGYNAMPSIEQGAYDPYFKAITNLWGVPLDSFARAQVNAPTSPFDSSELYALQQQTPDKGVKPIGYMEPFNEYQKAALSAMGAPDFSMNGLQQYLNPYQQMVQDNAINEINRSYDMSNNNIMDMNSRLNSRAMGSSLGTQLGLNQQNRARDIASTTANLGYQGYNSALDLRNQALQQQLAAGGTIQGLNQALLSASNPSGQLALNPDFLRASMLMPLYAAFPQASQSQSTSQSETNGSGNGFSQLFGAGLSLFG